MRTREELSGRSPIAPSQACLTLEYLGDGLSEKKLQLVGMSILLILLSPDPGCHNIEDGGCMKTRYRGEDLDEQASTFLEEQPNKWNHHHTTLTNTRMYTHPLS